MWWKRAKEKAETIIKPCVEFPTESGDNGNGNEKVTGPERVLLIADWQNITTSALEQFGKPVMINSIEDWARGSGMMPIAKIVHASRISDSFRQYLLKNSWLGKLFEGDVDAAVVWDICQFTNRVDTVVIATGDGDFVPVVKSLKQMGIKVVVMAFERCCSEELREEADMFVPFTAANVIRRFQKGVDNNGNHKMN